MWLSVLLRVFSNVWYSLLFFCVFLISLSILILLPNAALISKILSSGTASLLSKTELILSLYGSIFTNFTLTDALVTSLLFFLFSINVTLLVFYVRRAQKIPNTISKSQTTGLVGMVLGVLGIGCAACGSIILTGLTSTIGATGLMLLLPLHGGEFSILGVILLFVSIWYLVKKISNPLVCVVD